MLRSLLALSILCFPAICVAESPPCPKCVDHFTRSGKSTCVHRFAIPSNNAHYSGGIVGGGAVLKGDDPCLHEGTWGWDYSGIVPIKHIWLGWSHQHHQAGGGKYDTDRRGKVHHK